MSPRSASSQHSLKPLLITSAVAVIAYYVHNYSKHNTMFAARRNRYETFAGAIADKARVDEHWLSGDKQYLYDIQSAKIADDQIRDKMLVLSDKDRETEQFIANSVEKSDSILTQMWHTMAKSFLRLFYTQTDINGYLGRGSMFVFSQEQISQLLDKAGIRDKRFESLIDLGAGDGGPTAFMQPFFDEVYATEASWSMRSILSSKGFEIKEIEEWATRKYDAIACLNLLDRCEKPLTLLRQIKSALKPGGFVVVALVLPFKPFVEFGSKELRHRPVEKLPIHGETFEDQIPSVVKLFQEEGFRLKSWSRVPYLCEGDMSHSVYVLNDALFVFQHQDEAVIV